MFTVDLAAVNCKSLNNGCNINRQESLLQDYNYTLTVDLRFSILLWSTSRIAKVILFLFIQGAAAAFG